MVFHGAVPNVIGIIGGRGQFGTWTRAVFERHGCSCIDSDIDTPLSNIDVAAQSDLIVVSVPISATESVLREIAPALTPEKLVVDLTSVKSPLVKVLTALPSAVLSLHPMFSPKVSSLGGQTCVVCPIRQGVYSAFVEYVLSSEGIALTRMTPDEHDRMMAVVQGITHFQAIAAAHCMMALGVDLSKSLEVASPVYRLRLGMIGRVLCQDPKLYAEIQIYNPYIQPVLQQLAASSQLLAGLASARDVAGFEREFVASRVVVSAVASDEMPS
jgi:prephenate dehydrogenase